MDFIRKHILTSACIALGVLCVILPFDSIASLFFGGAIASFLFEANMAPSIADKLRKVAKL